jgi:hypothetical protein
MSDIDSWEDYLPPSTDLSEYASIQESSLEQHLGELHFAVKDALEDVQ